MPSINDIVNVAESLEKSPMVLLQDSCLSVRNRHAGCNKCVQACLYDCITVEKNKLSLKPLNCVNCGLCASACPTEAIRPVKPTDSATQHHLASAWRKANEKAVVACARIASKREADPNAYAEVPCLGHVHESLLLTPLSEGAQSVTLVDGNCSTCKYGFVNDSVDRVVETANTLLAATGAQTRVKRAGAFPDELLVEDSTGMYGSSRRTFFSDTVKSAREMAVSAADSALKQELGVEEEQSIGKRLRVSEEGTLPIIAVPRHDALVNALFALTEQADASAAPEAPASVSAETELKTRLFAKVGIDAVRCIQCGMCAVFCPTSALRRPPGSPVEKVEVLEFSASDCIQCNTCMDVCWKRCVSIEPAITFGELFSFDPAVIDLRPASSTN